MYLHWLNTNTIAMQAACNAMDKFKTINKMKRISCKKKNNKKKNTSEVCLKGTKYVYAQCTSISFFYYLHSISRSLWLIQIVQLQFLGFFDYSFVSSRVCVCALCVRHIHIYGTSPRLVFILRQRQHFHSEKGAQGNESIFDFMVNQ